MKRYTIEFICAEFKKEGYELLTKIYKNPKQKLDYICPRGHRHSVNWGNWISKGTRCPCFSNHMRPTIGFIRTEFEKEDYKLLTKVYKNNTQKLDYICPKGHHHSIMWGNWNFHKRRCPYCAGQGKPTIEFIRTEFEKENYTLLTTEYKNNRQKLNYICSTGHVHSTTWTNWDSNKRRCPFCSNQISKWEKEVKKFITNLSIDYVSNDKTQLFNLDTGRNLELDIWFPQFSKAIECNGVYWHKDRQHVDLLKKQLCKQQGIDLLTITDEEWNNDTDRCKVKLTSFVKVGV